MIDIANKKIDFFTSNLNQVDPDIAFFLKKELERQQNQIELIASENIVSAAVMSALGTVPTNKYAEGYPGKRYYGGCEYVDEIETIAIERAKLLFDCEYANVQPHSGSQANFAVFFALLNPGDTILGMSLNEGGHLTHGAAPSFSGKWFNAVHYGVSKDTHLIDYDQLESLALEHKPKIIIAGGSAYPREIDFKKFRAVADKVGAFLFADIAHYAGLISSKLYPSPAHFADVMTTTTHKTLRGPRGGMIMSNNKDLFKKYNDDHKDEQAQKRKVYYSLKSQDTDFKIKEKERVKQWAVDNPEKVKAYRDKNRDEINRRKREKRALLKLQSTQQAS